LFDCGWSLHSMHITKRKIILTSILAILILVLIANLIGVGDIVDVLRNASPALILLSIPVYLVSWPLRGARYQHILVQMNYRERLRFLVGGLGTKFTYTSVCASAAPHRPSLPGTPLFGYCAPQASTASQSPSAIQVSSSAARQSGILPLN